MASMDLSLLSTTQRREKARNRNRFDLFLRVEGSNFEKVEMHFSVIVDC